MIKASEKAQVLAPGEASVKARVAAGMVTELAANGARVENCVVARDLCAALGWQNERGENTQQGGFAGAIRAEQGQRFAGAHFE